jgi:serine protease Do
LIQKVLQKLAPPKKKRVMSNEQIQEWIERYSLGEMSSEERDHFEATLKESAELRKMYNEHKAFVRLVNHKAAKDLVSNQLAQIRQEQSGLVRSLSNSMRVHVNRYWKQASVAASVALITCLGTILATKNYYSNAMNSEILKLNRKVENNMRAVNKKVTALDSTLDKMMPEQPVGNALAAGTCFALNNNGYAITNAHVIEKGSTPYIFTTDNVGHKAEIISMDKDLDIAVLRIITPDFKFSAKSDVPYSIGNYSASMAQDVYTLGYPKNSVVYNRGYVSSQYGRDDDSSRYQLELPSSPGVSGSPVFDKKGNVVAMINSKESVGGGTTYALKSNKLKPYLNDIDSLKLSNNNRIAGMDAQGQIKALEDFVLVVKVY